MVMKMFKLWRKDKKEGVRENTGEVSSVTADLLREIQEDIIKFSAQFTEDLNEGIMDHMVLFPVVIDEEQPSFWKERRATSHNSIKEFERFGRVMDEEVTNVNIDNLAFVIVSNWVVPEEKVEIKK